MYAQYVCWWLNRSVFNSSFYNMEQLHILSSRDIATPPGWDACPSHVTPQHFCQVAQMIWGTLLLLGGERQCESNWQWPGQHSNPVQQDHGYTCLPTFSESNEWDFCLQSPWISEDVPMISGRCQRFPKMIRQFSNVAEERSDTVWRIQTGHYL